jgi:aspartyl protease family protein
MFRPILSIVIVLIVAGVAAGHFFSHFFSERMFSERVTQRSAAPPVLVTLNRPLETHGQITITPDRSGNYMTNVEIDGSLIRMVVDTGATYVSLTNEDADAIGFRPGPADYTYRTVTANGTGTAAKVHIDRLQIGSVEIDDVDAFVLPPGMLGTSLLGMSALNRLAGVQMSNGMLVLRQ